MLRIHKASFTTAPTHIWILGEEQNIAKITKRFAKDPI